MLMYFPYVLPRSPALAKFKHDSFPGMRDLQGIVAFGKWAIIRCLLHSVVHRYKMHDRQPASKVQSFIHE